MLVLSHLYPNARHPYLGLFVARQVQALQETHGIRVLAPTRWLPPLTPAWRNERNLPKREVVDGTPVYRPRALHLPFGMTTLETLALPVALRRPTRELRRERERLLTQRVLRDHRRLGIRERQARRLGHRVAAVAPGTRHPDEAGAEDAPTCVALVLRPERDRRECAAVGALGAQPTQGFRS